MIHTFRVGGNRFSGKQDKEDLRKALASIFFIVHGFTPASKVKFIINNIYVSTSGKTEATIQVDSLCFGLCYWDIRTVKWDDVENLLIFNDSLAIKG